MATQPPKTIPASTCPSQGNIVAEAWAQWPSRQTRARMVYRERCSREEVLQEYKNWRATLG
ncbi:MAG TPA: hypothetical protein VNU68_12900 [Verrucomicrobiae bacterium]|nr:hypothetical protein [Verrucomicrobiae bacterium]